jgi:vacuolar protein sorting-associated protein 41
VVQLREVSSLAIVVAANVLLDYKAFPHVNDEMTSPDTANTPTEHDTLKLNGNGNHNETTASLTTDGLTELKGKTERGGEDLVKDEEEGEEGEEDESEEEEEEDDEEPSLKYERITGAVPDLLKKDSASALAVSNKLLVISLTIISIIKCNL